MIKVHQMGWRALLLSIPFFFTVASCSTQQPSEKEPTMEPSTSTPPQKMVIYQMMTRLFGNKETANLRYGTLEENGVGKFNDISRKALQELQNLGITHVWYTGAIEHAVLTDYTAAGIALDDADVVKGRAGSPYAIKDYYDVNPDLATNVAERMAEFEALLQRTHEQGLKVLIDFVPNHVARGYQSDARPADVEDFGASDDKAVFFNNQNNFYYLPGEDFQVPAGYQSLGDLPFPTKDGQFEESPAKVTGNDQVSASPGVNDWFETIKLNYGVNLKTGEKTFEPVPNTWQKMFDILSFWTAKGVDGFRCDMAEMVPAEFWAWVIPKIKAQNPDIVFIAEIYNPAAYGTYIEQAKFDYLYDKVQLYDTLRHIVEGHGLPANISGVMQDLNPVDDHMLRFLENHDEQRIASPDFAGEAQRAMPAMVLNATIGKGPVMIYFGQEVGEPGAGDAGFGQEDGRTTIFDYWGVPEHQKWMNGGAFDGALLSDEQKALRGQYKQLLQLVNETEVFASGSFTDLMPLQTDTPESVYAYLRATETETWLVCVNFSEDTEALTLLLPEETSDLKPSAKNKLSTKMERPLSIVSQKINTEIGPYESIILQIR